jgi:hypothetical protein
MIRVERVGKNGWDVQVIDDSIRTEFSLVAAAVMRIVPKEEMIELVRKAAEHTNEMMQLNDKQSKLFYRRLFHQLELKNMTFQDLMQELGPLSLEDQADIQCGAIPSLETVRKIAKRFGVTECYLFGAENGADQRTD